VTEEIAEDPTLSCQDLARRLGVRRGHWTRTFKRRAKSSIVDYHNEVRLARFLNQANRFGLLDAALGAGFGSNAQFNRVFRARFGKAPNISSDTKMRSASTPSERIAGGRDYGFTFTMYPWRSSCSALARISSRQLR